MATTASRRSEVFPRSQKHARRAQEQQQQHQLLPPSPPAPRMKRPLDPIDNLTDPLKAKRTRISVEIFARPINQGLGPLRQPAPVKQQVSATQSQSQSQSQSQTQQTQTQPLPVASTQKRPSPAATNPLPQPLTRIPPAAPIPTATTASSTQPRPHPHPHHPTTTATNKEHGLTKHQAKVINGIRHELNRLQPNIAGTSTAVAGQPGRKLRSQEATRFKSELSAYFPEYDEVIGNDAKEQHLFNTDTPIIIIDTKHKSLDPAANPTNTYQHPTHLEPHHTTVRIYSDRLFTDLHNSQIVNFDYLETEYNSNHLEDPLPDSHYAPTHKKAERAEKSIRNAERGRAQHEKDQIIRLLGELQGYDWLRTMGVNGVTESRKKSFEPARDHFIKGCQSILDKFRLWSQEEKRRKLNRERALAEETDEDEDEDPQEQDEEEEEEEVVDDSDASEADGSLDDVNADADMADAGEESGDDVASQGDPPEYSDVDAAGRQLHDEALARAAYAASNSSRRTRGEPPPALPPPAPREFISFFEKKHQRDAALNKGRRKGRTILAWGHPVPEMSERDFKLPADCLDEDTLKAHERQKRRERRKRKL